MVTDRDVISRWDVIHSAAIVMCIILLRATRDSEIPVNRKFGEDGSTECLYFGNSQPQV